MPRTFTYLEQLERGILTEFRETLWQPFCRSVKRYKLIQPGDKICVCISGGKDSMLLAKLMADAQAKNPCFLCARMRRGCLYGKAQALGCNKIALGHHFDDVIETTLLGMMYGGQLQGMPPKLKAKNFPGMELIRPLYTVREDDICAWRDRNNLQFIQCACRLTEQASREEHVSKRLEVKRLIKALHEENPTLEWNIFGSIHNVQLDTMVGWKYKGKEISFLDGYDEAKGETDHGF